jgi:2-polyprenyl-3-methyl-5-hydroxy-6-metoxy-1,4-benzoquinol methylase
MTMTAQTTVEAPVIRPFDGEALVGRIFEQTLGAFELFNVYLGERLGLYRSLAAVGPANAGELAARAGIGPRYAQEWLEQQATAGILEVDDPSAEAGSRRYSLPAEHRAALLDEDSLSYAAFMPRFIASVGGAMPALLEAFRTGDGLAWDRYGDDMREAQAAANRPLFLSVVGQEWLAGIPDVHERLTAGPPARVADLGCGEGWLSIGLATAYPTIRVVGVDADSASIEAARRHATEANLGDRVTFELGDAAGLGSGEPFDLVLIFEALHDLSRPVEVLRAARALLAPGAAFVVVDERTADAFTGMALDDPVERFFYAVSTTVCLPNSLAEQPSAATGTVIRASTVERYALEAGFGSIEVLPIEHDLFRAHRDRRRSVANSHGGDPLEAVNV